MAESKCWREHVCRVGQEYSSESTPPSETHEIVNYRKRIEPWLSAVFQSEHLSLLVGNGLPAAVSNVVAPGTGASMGMQDLPTDIAENINTYAEKLARNGSRGTANFEDQLRAAIVLAEGLEIQRELEKAGKVTDAINATLKNLIADILMSERLIREAVEGQTKEGIDANRLLCSFLLSFASRAATRERLHIFTTNYDRLIEFGCDWIGLRVLDRFVGHLSPIFRSSRVDVDMHYNPPGIRGEPRYLEGVVKLTKLHGSLDWRYDKRIVRRVGIRFGTKRRPSDASSVLIYPNAAKDVETTEYPYADLLRDYAAAICRPNSALVTFGYGFGDDHINRVIRDMLIIPSTHLVIISWDDPGRDLKEGEPGRIEQFCHEVGRDAQISLLVGEHFGDLSNLVDHYLPKPAIDHITNRKARLEERRGDRPRAREDVNARDDLGSKEQGQ